MFKNKNLFLYIIILIFTVTYILSFSKNKTGKDYRKQKETELVNEKYENKINMFQIKQGRKLLTLNKKQDFWTVKYDNASLEELPADNKKIDSFIKQLIALRKVYKVADKPGKDNNFGLDDENTLTIRYYLEDDSFYDLIFGTTDFSRTYRYFMTGSSLSVYQIDSSLDSFLSTSVQNWSDPNIISTSILGSLNEKDVQSVKIIQDNITYFLNHSNTNDFYSKINKLLSLRHGGFALPTEDFIADFSMEIELGNKNWVLLQVSKDANIENDFILKLDYYIESNQSKNKYTFYSKISSWTYKSIKEITL